MRAIIVEDEINSRKALSNMVQKYCEGIELVDEVDSIVRAVGAIQKHQPDIVFLDIEFPEENGFAIFNYFPEPEFEIIYTTAYDAYALQALKMAAIDYLLKPIDLEELQSAINKVADKRDLQTAQDRLKTLKGNLNNRFHKLALPASDGFEFVELKDIIRCEAQGNYTYFYLVNGQKLVVSKTLKTYEDILQGFNFIRISRSQLINLNYIKRYTRGRNPIITMIDGTEVTVSISRKEEFLNAIEGGE